MSNQPPVQSKFKWNKSSLIDSDLYIRIYLAALNAKMSVEDKHALFMVSKFFTDGAAETGRGNFNIAAYYFETGENYYNRIPVEKDVLRRMISNVYHRSKSFYHYRLDDLKTAIKLIEETMQNSKELERQGFEFLVYDRAQQYYNLARICFARGDAERGLQTLGSSISFLLQGSTSRLIDLNDHCLTTLTPDIRYMRFAMLCQMLFESLEYLTKNNSRDNFIAKSQVFVSEILPAATNMKIFSPAEEGLKKWLLLLKPFYAGKYKTFSINATAAIKSLPKFFGDRPEKVMAAYLQYALPAVNS